MTLGRLSDEYRNEEAHGLWEFAIVRLAAFVEVGAPKRVLDEALQEERAAYKHWQMVNNEVTA